MQIDGEQIADLNKLLGDVFSSTVYNKQIRGQNDLTQTTNVTVTFSLHKILKFDELLESIQFHGKLLTEWVDERLVWSLRKYNGLKTVSSFKFIHIIIRHILYSSCLWQFEKCLFLKYCFS
jgi:hypothetical protein